MSGTFVVVGGSPSSRSSSSGPHPNRVARSRQAASIVSTSAGTCFLVRVVSSAVVAAAASFPTYAVEPLGDLLVAGGESSKHTCRNACDVGRITVCRPPLDAKPHGQLAAHHRLENHTCRPLRPVQRRAIERRPTPIDSAGHVSDEDMPVKVVAGVGGAVAAGRAATNPSAATRRVPNWTPSRFGHRPVVGAVADEARLCPVDASASASAASHPSTTACCTRGSPSV